MTTTPQRNSNGPAIRSTRLDNDHSITNRSAGHSVSVSTMPSLASMSSHEQHLDASTDSGSFNDNSSVSVSAHWNIDRAKTSASTFEKTPINKNAITEDSITLTEDDIMDISPGAASTTTAGNEKSGRNKPATATVKPAATTINSNFENSFTLTSASSMSNIHSRHSTSSSIRHQNQQPYANHNSVTDLHRNASTEFPMSLGQKQPSFKRTKSSIPKGPTTPTPYSTTRTATNMTPSDDNDNNKHSSKQRRRKLTSAMPPSRRNHLLQRAQSVPVMKTTEVENFLNEDDNEEEEDEEMEDTWRGHLMTNHVTSFDNNNGDSNKKDGVGNLNASSNLRQTLQSPIIKKESDTTQLSAVSNSNSHSRSVSKSVSSLITASTIHSMLPFPLEHAIDNIKGTKTEAPVSAPAPLPESSSSTRPWDKPISNACLDEGILQTPSGHTSINDSQRISTRSSLMVELSPPLTGGGGVGSGRLHLQQQDIANLQFQSQSQSQSQSQANMNIRLKMNHLSQYLKNASNPNSNNKHHTPKYRKSSSAFTVAGDQIATRFRNKSTSEVVELLLQQNQYEQSLETKVTMGENFTRQKQKNTKTPEHHNRHVDKTKNNTKDINGEDQDLDGSLHTNDLFHASTANHLGESLQDSLQRSIQSIGEEGMFGSFSPEGSTNVSNEGNGTHSGTKNDQKVVPVTTATRQELQSFLDGRSPKSRRNDRSPKSSSRSVSGEYASNLAQADTQLTQSPPKSLTTGIPVATTIVREPRRGRQRNDPKSLDEFKSPIGSKPTNRRTMMRKMQSVPILLEERESRLSRSQERRQFREAALAATTSSSGTALKSSKQMRRKARSLSRDKSDAKTSRSLSRDRSTTSQQHRDRLSNEGKVRERRGKKPEGSRSSSSKRTSTSSNKHKSERRRKKHESSSAPTVHSNSLDTDSFQDEMNKSFMDQFIDGEINVEDSAHAAEQNAKKKDLYRSQMESPATEPKTHVTSQRSPRRIRSQAKRPNTSSAAKPFPMKRKEDSEFRRVKSMVGPPSTKLVSLYSPIPEGNKPVVVTKASSTPKLKKKESRVAFKVEQGIENRACTPTQQEITQPTCHHTPSKTLQDLPRQGDANDDITVPDTSTHVKLVSRLQKLNMSMEDTTESKLQRLSSRNLIANQQSQSSGLDFEASNSSIINKFHSSFGGESGSNSKTPTSMMALHGHESNSTGITHESGWTARGVPRPPISIHSNSKVDDSPETIKTRKPRSGRKTARNIPGGMNLHSKKEKEHLESSIMGITDDAMIEIPHDHDDNTVFSDITDGFSAEPASLEFSRRTRKAMKELAAIDESGAFAPQPGIKASQQSVGDTSWCGLTHSDQEEVNDSKNGTFTSISNNSTISSSVLTLKERVSTKDDSTVGKSSTTDRRQHMAKRWQSTGALQSDVLHTPQRRVSRTSLTSSSTSAVSTTTDSQPAETLTPSRLSWWKKKMGKKKK